MSDMAKRRFEELKANDLLPSPKGVALTILEMNQRPDVCIGEIVPLVQMDPAMAGRLLKYVNVARGGSQRPIVSLKQAIMFLGLFRVQQIALAFSLIDQHGSGNCTAFDYAGYWTTSLATGIAAQQIALQASSPPDECFSCGLLSGIGRLVLATAYPGEYAEILRSGLSEKEMYDAELSRFGIDHAFLSAEMLLSWGLPDIFANAVRYHEQPADAPFAPGTRAHAMTSAFHFAMRIGQLLNLDETHRWDRVPYLFHAAAQAGMEQDEVPSLVDRVMTSWQEWAQELKLPTRAYPDLVALLASPSVPRSNEDMLARMVLPLRVVLMVRNVERLRKLSATLDSLGLHTEAALDWNGVRCLLRQHAPNVAIIDVESASAESIEQLRILRSEAGTGFHCIALLADEAEANVANLMLAGASDYLLYDPTEAALLARLANAQRLVSLQGTVKAGRELAISSSNEWGRANRRLLYDALTDVLTQLPNRRYGLDRFTQEWSVASSSASPISCIMIDIDHFKRINDQRGHEIGDVALRQLAAVIEGNCRSSDIVFRYGGEEFCVICPSTGLDEAMLTGERIAEAVRTSPFGKQEDPFPITLSVGVAVRTPDLSEPDDLVAVADRALYAAKAGGRDRVVAA